MKKRLATFLTGLITLPIFAVGEHAAWDELSGNRNSSLSDFGVIFRLIIGLVIIGGILIKLVISKDYKEDKGCSIFFYIGIMIVLVILAFVLLSK